MKAKLLRLLNWVSWGFIVLCFALVFLAGRVIPFAYVEAFQPAMLPIVLLLGIVRLLLTPRSGDPDRPLAEPAPAISGGIVILATGFAAAAWLGYTGFVADGWSGLILPLMIALLTVAIAMAAARFASRHEGEIGEARFETSARP